MQQVNRPMANSGTSTLMGTLPVTSTLSAYAMLASATASNCRYGLRRYQPLPSKHRMKVSR